MTTVPKPPGEPMAAFKRRLGRALRAGAITLPRLRASIRRAVSERGKYIWLTNTPLRPEKWDLREDPRYYWEWRCRLIEGLPKASSTYSIRQLQDMGMIGLYKEAA